MKLEIYGKANCDYCSKAKQYADELFAGGYLSDYRSIDIEEQDIQRAYLENRARERIQSIPVIFMNDIFIGGYQELRELIAI